MLARQDMAAAGMQDTAGPSSESSLVSSSNNRGSSSSANSTKQMDTAAAVDELRAEIAYTRASLQLLRTGGKSGARPGPPPTAASVNSSS